MILGHRSPPPSRAPAAHTADAVASVLEGSGARGLLLAGVVGNGACIALWALSRTSGLPLGLLPAPEAVGAWDLAALAWELVLVGACLALLRGAPAGRRTTPGRWHPAATAFLGASVPALGLLSLSGTGG